MQKLNATKWFFAQPVDRDWKVFFDGDVRVCGRFYRAQWRNRMNVEEEVSFMGDNFRLTFRLVGPNMELDLSGGRFETLLNAPWVII